LKKEETKSAYVCCVFFIYEYNKVIILQCVDPMSCITSRCLCNAVSRLVACVMPYHVSRCLCNAVSRSTSGLEILHYTSNSTWYNPAD